LIINDGREMGCILMEFNTMNHLLKTTSSSRASSPLRTSQRLVNATLPLVHIPSSPQCRDSFQTAAALITRPLRWGRQDEHLHSVAAAGDFQGKNEHHETRLLPAVKCGARRQKQASRACLVIIKERTIPGQRPWVTPSDRVQ
jgi:hypothetical protein